jgi:hypothetical protein
MGYLPTVIASTGIIGGGLRGTLPEDRETPALPPPPNATPTHISHQLGGQPSADPSCRMLGPGVAQQFGGSIGRELLPDRIGEEVPQEHVEAVQAAGTFADQVLAPLGEQPQDLGAALRGVLGLDRAQPIVSQISEGGEGSVQRIVLSGVAGREYYSRVRRAWAGRRPPSRQRLGASVLEGVRCRLRPPQPNCVSGSVWPIAAGLAVLCGWPRRSLLLDQLSLLVDRRDDVSRLVGIDADEHFHALLASSLASSVQGHRGVRRTIRVWVRSPRLC